MLLFHYPDILNIYKNILKSTSLTNYKKNKKKRQYFKKTC